MPKVFDSDTNTQGVIVYGSESSDNYGMVISEAPAFERPVRKQTVFTVPGRNGAIIYQENAWEDVTRSYNVWIDNDDLHTLSEKVNAFEAALNSQSGWQRLEDNFEPDYFRLAYYAGGDEFSNNMTAYGEATLNFICRPERFLKTGETAIEVDDGDTITNPTKFASKPLIKIEVPSETTVTIEIGDNQIEADITDYIYIDCDTMNAYRQPAENMNGNIRGTFPVLAPGANVVGITGTVTTVEITPRYFTI